MEINHDSQSFHTKAETVLHEWNYLNRINFFRNTTVTLTASVWIDLRENVFDLS